MEITDWKHLPFSGGLMEQPNWLIEDLLTLSSRASQIREMLKPPKS